MSTMIDSLRIVLCHGTWDRLHLGHIRHLREARTHGDKLIVSVTDDPFVAKGVGRPVFDVHQRMETLQAIGVDQCIISKAADAVAVINVVRPAVYCKGIDYAVNNDPALQREIKAVVEHGGTFVTTRSEKWSSSRIIVQESMPPETVQYLESARQRGFLDKIKKAFEDAAKLKVLFVGERIIDEYRYVKPLGKASKEFILATVETGRERFEGGVMAARSNAVSASYTEVATADHAILKTRWIGEPHRKLFEVYSNQRINLDNHERAHFKDSLQKGVNFADVIIVLDFGHGLMDGEARSMLAHRLGKYVAVNVQSNSGNFGFNRAYTYPGADFLCLDEQEARLLAGNQFGSIDEVITGLHSRDCAVTLGKAGAIVCKGTNEGHSHSGFNTPIRVPAFALGGVDTIGAGDAFLAVTAPLLAAGLDLEAAALVGNVAGAIKVGIIGHRRSITKDEVLQTVTALLA